MGLGWSAKVATQRQVVKRHSIWFWTLCSETRQLLGSRRMIMGEAAHGTAKAVPLLRLTCPCAGSG
jgi:hypothetical protein